MNPPTQLFGGKKHTERSNMTVGAQAALASAALSAVRQDSHHSPARAVGWGGLLSPRRGLLCRNAPAPGGGGLPFAKGRP